MAGRKKRWLVDVTAFTIAGVAASAIVGAALGWLGGLLMPGPLTVWEIQVTAAVAMTAIAREMGWLAVPLLQVRRQTRGVWAKVLPGTPAAALWGFDVGLGFATWLTFSGPWVLALVAIAFGEPRFGAALFGLYWLGRALPVWLSPLLLPDASATDRLLGKVAARYRLLQQVHAMGVACLVSALVVSAVRG